MHPDAGYYLYSLLILFLAYVFIFSIIEGLKKKFHWRWGIIILLALYAFFEFGIKTKTFEFMWRKATEFFHAPPWRSQTGELTNVNNMRISEKPQAFNQQFRR